ncbi:hypothetical protein HYDPIDRAFT_171201, partial [Hydnomerulius pinastri MD-312]
ILRSMTSVLAPVLPHLAEEINAQSLDGATSKSFFAQKWEPLSTEWDDPQAEKDMGSLLMVRNTVLSLLENARGDKNLKSALEAKVTIAIPSDAIGTELIQLLRREGLASENLLKTLFIVSDVRLTDRGDRPAGAPEWSYSGSLKIPDSDAEITIRVEPATLRKCPRCWTFARTDEDELCQRCKDVGHSRDEVGGLDSEEG